ncbi:MAG: hypothetical protein SGI92_29415 [Bryobacteraceae bacterium]|nr:hypothetical protein [Bryobacteraceae bacterium]
MFLLRPLSLAVLSCCVLHADVSQTFVVRIQPTKALPPELAEQVAKQFAATVDSMSFETKIKGSRALVRMGTFVSVSDFDGALLTVVDRQSKRYSTVSPQEYQRAWRSFAEGKKQPAASLKKAMTVDTKPHPTGKTRTIHGIAAEEYLFGISAPVSGKESIAVRVSVWVPVQAERVRHPALLEMQRYTDRAYVPGDFLADLTKSLDVSGKGIGELVETMKSIGMYLEMRASYAVPGMGNEPLVETVQELIEFSTDEIPDAVFAVPRDYTPVSINELLPEVLSPTSLKPGDVKAPVMLPGTGDDDPAPDRPKLQRRKP